MDTVAGPIESSGRSIGTTCEDPAPKMTSKSVLRGSRRQPCRLSRAVSAGLVSDDYQGWSRDCTQPVEGIKIREYIRLAPVGVGTHRVRIACQPVGGVLHRMEVPEERRGEERHELLGTEHLPRAPAIPPARLRVSRS